MIVKRVVRFLSVLTVVFFSSAFVLSRCFLPSNFSYVTVTLHPSSRDSEMEETWGLRLFDSYSGVDSLDGRTVVTDSHIAAVSREGVTLRIHLQETPVGQSTTRVDQLIFIPANEPVNRQLTPDINLVAEISR